MRDINKIIIHCADTPKAVYFDIEDIRKWHVEERGWSDVGYHFVVLLDGTIQNGRDIKIQGAHVRGHNRNSIGICYIGGGGGLDTRTCEQKDGLYNLIENLKLDFPSAKIHGHNEFSTKACPCFDANKEYN